MNSIEELNKIKQSVLVADSLQTYDPDDQIKKHKKQAYQIQNLLMNYDSQYQQCKCECHIKKSSVENRQLQSLKLKMHLLKSQHNFNEKMLKNQLDQLKYENQCIMQQNKKFKQVLNQNYQETSKLQICLQKYQNKIKNQEALIDQYQKSLQQQINLEKQVVKAAFIQKQNHLRNQFEKALRNMQYNYQKQLKDLQKQQLTLQYTHDIKSIKKYCSKLMDTHSKKQMNFIGKQNYKHKFTSNNNFKKLNGSSSYSTIDK